MTYEIPKGRGLFRLVALLGALAPSAAWAQDDGSCARFLDERFSWVEQRRDERRLFAVVSSHRRAISDTNRSLVSFSTVALWTYAPPRFVCEGADFTSCRWQPATLSGVQGQQLFSDRTFVHAGRRQGFSAFAPDSIGLTLERTGRAVLTLETWGGGRVVIEPTTCADGLLHGVSREAVPTHYTISLEELYIPG